MGTVKKKSRLGLVLALAFFLGFPLAGMLFVYFQAHATMRASAIEFSQKKVAVICDTKDAEELRFLGTIDFKRDFEETDFQAPFEALGDFRELGEFKVRRSTVSERSDQVWQVVWLTAPVTFERGSATLELRVARRSIALSEWRIDSWQIDRE
jgi:hypothetical protein